MGALVTKPNNLPTQRIILAFLGCVCLVSAVLAALSIVMLWSSDVGLGVFAANVGVIFGFSFIVLLTAGGPFFALLRGALYRLSLRGNLAFGIAGIVCALGTLALMFSGTAPLCWFADTCRGLRLGAPVPAIFWVSLFGAVGGLIYRWVERCTSPDKRIAVLVPERSSR
ncbi:MAG: hypothetical protein ACFB11_24005 [Paracoccaceae bacterium]